MTAALVQGWRGEACTGGGVRPVQEVVRKAHCPFCLKMRNWIGGGCTGEY